MPYIPLETNRLDADESIFFNRQLESIMARSFDVLYPELKAIRLIPVDTSAGPGADSITYRQFNTVGLAKVIANYADDLPRADILGKEFTSKVRSIGGSYGYSLQEVRSAAQADRPLQQMKANAARRANDQTVDKIAWLAKSTDELYGGLIGFLFAPNITTGTAPAGATTGKVPWWTAVPADHKNPLEILEDLNNLISDIVDLTKGVEVPDTIIMPIKQFSHLQTTKLEAGTDTTIMQFFLANNPSVTSIEWVNELKALAPLPSGGAGPSDIAVCYKRSPDKLSLQIPSPYEQLPAQERNLEFVVPTHSRHGGVIVHYPLSASILEGI